MRAKMIPLLMVPLLLSACEVKVGKNDKDKADGNVSVAANDEHGVSISAPGFNAKVDIPGIEIGGDDMDIDGMKLFPGSKVGNVNVVGKDGPGDRVTMGFTAPGAPAAVASYYANAARENGFTDVKVAGTTVSAVKDDGDAVTIAIVPAPGGSSGDIRIVDNKE
jgi:hypothetical protein